jgi:hypothetical protein
LVLLGTALGGKDAVDGVPRPGALTGPWAPQGGLRPVAGLPWYGDDVISSARKLVAEPASKMTPESTLACAIIGGISTTVGLGIVSILLCTKSNAEMIQKSGVETEGVVQKKDTWVTHGDVTGGEHTPGHVHYSVTVTYDADRKDGKRVRITQSKQEIIFKKWVELTEGGLVRVKYLPTDPTQQLIVDGQKEGFGVIFGVYKDGFGWVWVGSRPCLGYCFTLFLGAPLTFFGLGLGMISSQFGGLPWALTLYAGVVVGCFGCCGVVGKFCRTVQKQPEIEVDENPSGPIPKFVLAQSVAPIGAKTPMDCKFANATLESESDCFF